MDSTEWDFAGTMDDDDVCMDMDMDSGNSNNSQTHQQQHAPPQAQGQWPFRPMSGNASAPISSSAASPHPKPKPKQKEGKDIVKISMQGQKWLGVYTVNIDSQTSRYHDTEAELRRLNDTQHIVVYHDGTQEVCDDADYAITKPRPKIEHKEKQDADVDDLEVLMHRSSLK